MKIIHSSELMKNQRQAAIMSPGAAFQALQTYDSHSLFFSIGTDQVLYLTKELDKGITGWEKNDLSSRLKQRHQDKRVIAKTFTVSQNQYNGNIDIALAISVDNVDYLYISLGNSYTDTSWINNIDWVYYPFDDPDHIVPILQIQALYSTQSPTKSYFLADILKDPGTSLNYIYRYAIDTEKKDTGKAWSPNDLSANMNADDIQSVPGRKKAQTIDGIYTYGKNVDKEQLLYTPLWNVWDPATPPNPVRLTAPPHTTAITSAIAAASGSGAKKPDCTNLFLIAEDTLYLFPWDAQTDGASAVRILSHSILRGTGTLYAHTTSSTVVIWGLDFQGAIFYLQCPAGKERDPNAWSYPLPILTGVESLSFYLDRERDNVILFAHTQGLELIQLTQDPVTTMWLQRNIVLPLLDTDDMLESDTFTTHLQINQDDNLPARAIPVTITATSPVTVYINNAYRHLHQTIGQEVLSDDTGVITIMQITQGLGAVCYHLTLPDGSAADVNPMLKMVDIMGTIHSGSELASVEVTNADGTRQPLVPKDTPADQLDTTAESLQQLVEVSKNLPTDGSNQSSRNRTRSAPQPFIATPPTIWAVSYAGPKWQYFEGAAALDFLSRQYGGPDFQLNAIVCRAGDAINWLKNAYNDVKVHFVRVVDGVYNFFIDIAGQLYTFVLDSINTVVSTIEFVFNKIKVFIEDLIKWIGFLFKWADIIRTHNVLKNTFKQFAGYSIQNIDVTKEKLMELFKVLEEKIDGWSGLIPDIPSTISDFASGSTPEPDQNSPQANWGIYQFKNNSEASSTDYTPDVSGNDTLMKLFEELLAMIKREEGVLSTAYEEIKTQIVDQLTSLSVTEIIRRFIGILTDALLDTAENLIITVIDILKILVQGLFDLLDAPIRIPVLSKLYKLITGNQLSMLDLLCLIAAIPVTLIYKIRYNAAPYPDDEFTRRLIAAPDFQTIRELYRKEQDLLSSGSAEVSPSHLATWIFACSISAGAGSICMGIVTVLKFKYPNNKVYAAMGVPAYLLYMSPNITPFLDSQRRATWYNIMNDCISCISAVKAFPDALLCYRTAPPIGNGEDKSLMGVIGDAWYYTSPWVELGLNFVWFVPPIATLIYPDEGSLIKPASQPGTILDCAADFSFNLGGMLTPGTTFGPEKSKLVSLVVMTFCITIYGILEVISTGWEKPEGAQILLDHPASGTSSSRK